MCSFFLTPTSMMLFCSSANGQQKATLFLRPPISLIFSTSSHIKEFCVVLHMNKAHLHTSLFYLSMHKIKE